MWHKKNYRVIYLKTTWYIITSLALNLPILTFFHITTHALFKALLFIGAGSFINYHHHSQDLRWIGNLSTQIPITVSCITIANLALCGFPFIAGFYSKDFIMEMAIASPINEIILVIIIISIGLTAFYSIRFSIATIIGPSQSRSWISISEETKINIPILTLSSIATVSGALLIWLNPVRNNLAIVPFYIKIAPTILILSGLILGFTISNINKYLISIKNNINHYARCIIWFLVPLSTQLILDSPLKLAHINLKTIDQGWVEFPQFIHYIITQTNIPLIKYSPIQASQIIITLSISVFLFSIILIKYCLSNLT